MAAATSSMEFDTDSNNPYDERTVINTQELIGRCVKCCGLKDRDTRLFFAKMFPRRLWATCVNILCMYHASNPYEFAFWKALTPRQSRDRQRQHQLLVALLEVMAKCHVDCSAFNLWVSSVKDLAEENGSHDENDYDDELGKSDFVSSIVVQDQWKNGCRHLTLAIQRLDASPTEDQLRSVMAAFRLLGQTERSLKTSAPSKKKTLLVMSEEGKKFLSKKIPVRSLISGHKWCPASALAFVPLFEWARNNLLEPGEKQFCTDNTQNLNSQITLLSCCFVSSSLVEVTARLKCKHKRTTEAFELQSRKAKLTFRCCEEGVIECRVHFPRELLVFKLLLMKFSVFISRNDSKGNGCDRELLFASVLYDIMRMPRDFKSLTKETGDASLAEIRKLLEDRKSVV